MPVVLHVDLAKQRDGKGIEKRYFSSKSDFSEQEFISPTIGIGLKVT